MGNKQLSAERRRSGRQEGGKERWQEGPQDKKTMSFLGGQGVVSAKWTPLLSHSYRILSWNRYPSSWSRGSSPILGEEGEMGRMGFWGPVLPIPSCPWAAGAWGEGTGWGSGLGGGGMSSHTLPHSRPDSSLSLPKVAQAGSLSPWKPLSIVKVQKIWKRRTVP